MARQSKSKAVKPTPSKKASKIPKEPKVKIDVKIKSTDDDKNDDNVPMPIVFDETETENHTHMSVLEDQQTETVPMPFGVSEEDATQDIVPKPLVPGSPLVDTTSEIACEPMRDVWLQVKESYDLRGMIKFLRECATENFSGMIPPYMYSETDGDCVLRRAWSMLSDAEAIEIESALVGDLPFAGLGFLNTYVERTLQLLEKKQL